MSSFGGVQAKCDELPPTEMVDGSFSSDLMTTNCVLSPLMMCTYKSCYLFY